MLHGNAHAGPVRYADARCHLDAGSDCDSHKDAGIDSQQDPDAEELIALRRTDVSWREGGEPPVDNNRTAAGKAALDLARRLLATARRNAAGWLPFARRHASIVAALALGRQPGAEAGCTAAIGLGLQCGKPRVRRETFCSFHSSLMAPWRR